MMAAWDLAMEVWLNQAEAATRLYPAELAEYRAAHPMPNVGEFMKGEF